MEQCVARLERGFAAAVAQTGSLLYRRLANCVGIEGAADCQSAIRQTNCLRYRFTRCGCRNADW
jgi:hypothetical protein